MDIQTYGHYMLKFHIDSHIAFLAFQSVDVLSFRLAIIESALEASIRRLSRINVICVGSNPREAMFWGLGCFFERFFVSSFFTCVILFKIKGPR